MLNSPLRTWNYLLISLFTLFISAVTLQAAPASLTQTVTYQGKTITMQLTQQSLRGQHFEVLTQGSTGTYTTVTAVAERSYLGTVDGYPGAVASGILKDNGQFWGAVYFDRGVIWLTLADQVTNTRGVDHGPNDFKAFVFPTRPSVLPGTIGSDMHRFDVGFDVRNDYYTTRANSNVATALEMIEYSFAVVRPLYMSNLLLRPYLARIIIRTDAAQDPCNAVTRGEYLPKLRDHWNAEQTSANRDVVVGLNLSIINGGLAYLGQIGNSSAYSVNDSDPDGTFHTTWQHELGHNWNGTHYVGNSPEGSTVMSGNGPARFSGTELYKMLTYRANRISNGSVLDNEGAYTTVNLPPYAALDAYTPEAGSLNTLDVLANDFDANGHTFSLTTVDQFSALGGRCSISVGTGPGGRNQILYRPSGKIGTDYFQYKIVDSTGQSATGVAISNVSYASVSYEAESATISGPVVANTPSGFSGTGFVDFKNASNDYIEWNINVATAGNYLVSFQYTNDEGGDVPLQLKANGAIVAAAFPFIDTSSLTAWTHTATQSVTLTAGSNTVRLTTTGSNGPNIDFLKVSQTADTSTPQDPYFYSAALTRSKAKAGASYVGSLVNSANDPNPNQALSYSKLSGPDWLTVSSSGALGGTPAVDNIGTHSFVIRVTDTTGRTAQTNLSIEVISAEVIMVGRWDFNDPQNLTKATIGTDLTQQGSSQAVSGTTSGDGAARIGVGSFFTSSHGISANGGGSKVNEYSLVFDLSYPVTSDNQWKALFQTTIANNDDAESFIRNSNQTIGLNDTGYTSATIAPATWTRIVITVDNGSSYKIYANGTQILDGTMQPLDGNFSLSSKLLFFADNSGEDYPVDISSLRIYDGSLSSSQVTALGSVSGSNNVPIFTTNPMTRIQAEAGNTYNSTIMGSATDLDGDSLTYSKLTGASWLTIASNGVLSGTPVSSDIGLNNFTVRVDDGNGGTANAELKITVVNAATPTIPTVSNGVVSHITTSAAELAINLTSNGNENPIGTLFYGTSDGGTNPASWTNNIALGTMSSGIQNSALSGLKSGTLYYYKTRVTNSAGTGWSSTGSFRTTIDPAHYNPSLAKDSNGMAFSFTRPVVTNGLTFEAYQSTNLIDWNMVQHTLRSNDGTSEIREVKFSTNAPKIFFRIKVIQTP